MASCTVSTIIKDLTDTALSGVVLKLYGSTPKGISTTTVVAAEEVEITSGPTADNPGWAAGYIEFDAIQSSEIRLWAPRLGLYNKLITIPATSTADLSTLIEE